MFTLKPVNQIDIKIKTQMYIPYGTNVHPNVTVKILNISK